MIMKYWFVVLLLIGVTSINPANAEAESKCDSDEWQCTDDKDCIFLEYLCDGDTDCYDKTDEDVAMCLSRNCREGEEFRCASNYELGVLPVCIPNSWLCDGTDDCEKGEDEHDCNGGCPHGGYRCQYQERCLPAQARCNHIKDCSAGDDEVGCNYTTCTKEQFTCHYGACIERTRRCDGTKDCIDGSDELHSVCNSTETCPPGQFRCKNGQCVQEDRLCTGRVICADRTDESICVNVGVNECNNRSLNHCEQVCVNTLFSFHCDCSPGYTLHADRIHCQDIDECVTIPGACEQICHNVHGSYSCACVEGHRLDRDKRSCRKLDSIVPEILLADGNFITKMTVTGSRFQIIFKEAMSHTVEFDSVDNFVYYENTDNNALFCANMTSRTRSKTFLRIGLDVQGIAVDWVARKLYMTEGNLVGVIVTQLNGTQMKLLVGEYGDSPRAIGVHPRKGYVFWTDWGSAAFIARVGMDGTQAMKIVTTAIVWPNGLTIDYSTNRIWWCDAGTKRIEYADMDGRNRHIVLANVLYPYGVTIFGKWVYWTDWTYNSVHKADRFTGANQTVLYKSRRSQYDIKIRHPLRQPHVMNPCGDNNGGCSHLCLIKLGGGSVSCACPETMRLNNDGRTCSAQCKGGQFECGRSDHKCIPELWVCDGQNDCQGGEDEKQNCGQRKCPPGVYECADHRCLPPMSICDGVKQCSGGEDEAPAMCSQRQCPIFLAKCNDTGMCIPKSWICDGDRDCVHGADELNCPSSTGSGNCTSDEFRCKTSSSCIPKEWMCDIDHDCDDGSDENATYCYLHRQCHRHWIPCNNTYICIPPTALCDGHDNCGDGSDEAKDVCPKCDPKVHFQCDSGWCIPASWHCDGHEDCADKSDEKGCKSTPRECESNQFRCPSGMCISDEFVCDTHDDCGDMSDERNCKLKSCRADQFRCSDGACVPQADVCDRWEDCRDGSDERNCKNQYPNANFCRTDQYQCTRIQSCVDKNLTCDGYPDCADESDESVSLCGHMACDHKNHFRCVKNTSHCIWQWQMCDGVDDCGDGSDENNVTICHSEHQTHTCDFDEFKCANKKCIHGDVVCNRHDDCGDASDEKGCHKASHGDCSSNNGGCSGKCNPLSQGGYYCSCADGFEVSTDNPKHCIDVDECAKWGNFCPQICINTKGSFQCGCESPFTDVTGKGEICDPPVGTAGEMESYTIAVGSELRQYSFRKKEYTAGIPNLGAIRAFDVHLYQRLVYWIDYSDRSIKRSMLKEIPGLLTISDKQLEEQNLGIKDMIAPASIAIDWFSGNIYWSDEDNRSISVCREDGNYQKIIVRTGNFKPISIVVDPRHGFLFWIEKFGRAVRIQRSQMDGLRLRTIVSSSVHWPVQLAIDYHMKSRLFWADSMSATIESSAYDGSDRITVIRKTGHLVGLDVFAHYIHWLSQNGQLMRQDKFGRGMAETVLTGLTRAVEFKVLHYHRYKHQGYNPCARNKCNGLCVLVPHGSRCLCPDNGTVLTNGDCDLSHVTFTPREQPGSCHCLHGGVCMGPSIGNHPRPCRCPAGYVGQFCEFPSKPGTPAEVTDAESVITLAPPNDKIGKISAKSDKGSKNKKAASIAIPVGLLLVLAVVVVVALFVMYRRGKFRNIGRRGDRLTNNEQELSQNTTSTFMNPVAIEPYCGDPASCSQYSNAIYGQLPASSIPQTVKDGAAASKADNGLNNSET